LLVLRFALRLSDRVFVFAPLSSEIFFCHCHRFFSSLRDNFFRTIPFSSSFFALLPEHPTNLLVFQMPPSPPIPYSSFGQNPTSISWISPTRPIYRYPPPLAAKLTFHHLEAMPTFLDQALHVPSAGWEAPVSLAVTFASSFSFFPVPDFCFLGLSP